MKNRIKNDFRGKRKTNFRHKNFKRRRAGGKARGQKMSPELFIKKAKSLTELKYISQKKFSDFDLHSDLKIILDKIGFEIPTEIQDKTIEAISKRKDILGIADTGTGKTGAFLIPLINRLLKDKNKFETLIITPTRELALQIEKDLFEMSKGLGLFSITLTGGTPVWKDIKKLKRENNFIIGTPGRLMDLVLKKSLILDSTKVLVLDEFDRMLDMGFVNDIRFLIEKMTSLEQRMLFSATVTKKLQPVIDEVVKNPFKVVVGTGGKTSENVEQDIVRAEDGETKFDKLFEMLNQNDFEKTIVFTETKHSVKSIYRNLRDAKSNLRVECLHGDKDQATRNRALHRFKEGSSDVLIATDVAARGLDIKGVTHVINFEIPRDYDSYIHRIGRTGRAGKLGHSFTFVD